MYICICNAVTDRQIRKAAQSGVTDFYSLQSELGVGAGCGSCKDAASVLLNESKPRGTLGMPRIYRPALA